MKEQKTEKKPGCIQRIINFIIWIFTAITALIFGGSTTIII